MIDTSMMLELRGVAHHFGGLKVLADVNFGVKQGEVVGLIGPNGSGKTTCFNIVSGFLQPREGHIFFQGKNITDNSIQERCRAGLVRTFQTPLVFEHMTVLENLMVGSYKNTGSSLLSNIFQVASARRDWRLMLERALEVSEKFSLNALLNTRAGALPAGQRRIIELARACAADPALLLLDEPSSGLNSGEIDVLRGWISTLNNDGMTILLVSHDMALMTVASQVHALYFGKIICSGSMDEVRSDPHVREAYLGV